MNARKWGKPRFGFPLDMRRPRTAEEEREFLTGIFIRALYNHMVGDEGIYALAWKAYLYQEIRMGHHPWHLSMSTEEQETLDRIDAIFAEMKRDN